MAVQSTASRGATHSCPASARETGLPVMVATKVPTAFTTFSDPRIKKFVLEQEWSEFERRLIAGDISWGSGTMDEAQRASRDHIEDTIRQMQFQIAINDIAAHVSASIPAPWSINETLVEPYSLQSIPAFIVDVLPVGSHGVIPIYKAIILGRTFDDDRERPAGLRRDVFIVGRVDVRYVSRFQIPGDVVGTLLGHVRNTHRKALATARKVEAALADWNDFCAAKGKRDVLARARREERRLLKREKEDYETNKNLSGFIL